MGMTKHHHDQILDSQTSNAKKVYECIPSADFWTGPQIAAELFRQGSKQDTNRVMGCINTLVDAGLVRERGKKFQRAYTFPLVEAPKQQQKLTTQPPPPKPEPKDMPAPPSTTPAPAMASDPLLRMLQHADYLRRLADDIELAAMEAQQQNEEAKKKGRRFEQLQTLLKEATE